MEENYYMINLQKVLYIMQELHKRGYEKLRLIPSVSPSGMSWRCSFLAQTSDRNDVLIVSNWIQDKIEYKEREIDRSISDLADSFEREHFDFMAKCKGENEMYVEWYGNMLSKIQRGELPYAFDDYFGPTNYWKTTKQQQIFTLRDELDYY
jgi:hypothetical protein